MSLTARPDSQLAVVDDSMLVRWRPMAKDGRGLPAAARSLRAAHLVVGMGETYDFAYTPAQRGSLRLEVRTNGPRRVLLIGVPIRVE